MTIYKKDGSEYSAGGKKSLQNYRPNGADKDLFDKLDIEQIELTGSPIIYYKCFIDTDFDKLYMESRDSIWAQEGIKLYSTFVPVRPTQQLGGFGIDSPDEVIFNFNITQWKELVGDMPKIKSLIFTEYDSQYYEIIQKDFELPYRLWSKYRLQVTTRKYQPNRTDPQPVRRDAGNSGIF